MGLNINFDASWKPLQLSGTIALVAAAGVAAACAVRGRKLQCSDGGTAKPERLSPNIEKHKRWMKSMRAFIFDIDGVIYDRSGAVQGAGEALNALRKAGKTVVFMTNNAMKSQEDVVEAFKKNGATCKVNEVMTSGIAAAEYLQSQGLKVSKVYVVGMPALRETLQERAGVFPFGAEDDATKTSADCEKDFFPTLSPAADEVSAVVVGVDQNFNYYKLARAINYLRQSPTCLFVATNADAVVKLGSGNQHSVTMIPEAGPCIEAIAFGASRRPDIVCGKPSASLARLMLERNGLDPDSTCMVGDRIDTDIEFGRNGGMYTIFVESGTMKEADARNAAACRRPDFIAPSIAILRDLV